MVLCFTLHSRCVIGAAAQQRNLDIKTRLLLCIFCLQVMAAKLHYTATGYLFSVLCSHISWYVMSRYTMITFIYIYFRIDHGLYRFGCYICNLRTAMHSVCSLAACVLEARVADIWKFHLFPCRDTTGRIWRSSLPPPGDEQIQMTNLELGSLANSTFYWEYCQTGVDKATFQAKTQ